MDSNWKAFNISTDNSICNANQPANLPWKIHFDLVNRSTSGTSFTIHKKQKLCFITTLNEGMDKLKVKYTKKRNMKIISVKILYLQL